jgi:hypothetical protein
MELTFLGGAGTVTGSKYLLNAGVAQGDAARGVAGAPFILGENPLARHGRRPEIGDEWKR